MTLNIITVLLIVAFAFGLSELFRSDGKSLPGWGLLIGFGALLMDRLGSF